MNTLEVIGLPAEGYNSTGALVIFGINRNLTNEAGELRVHGEPSTPFTPVVLPIGGLTLVLGVNGTVLTPVHSLVRHFCNPPTFGAFGFSSCPGQWPQRTIFPVVIWHARSSFAEKFEIKTCIQHPMQCSHL